MEFLQLFCKHLTALKKQPHIISYTSPHCFHGVTRKENVFNHVISTNTSFLLGSSDALYERECCQSGSIPLRQQKQGYAQQTLLR